MKKNSVQGGNQIGESARTFPLWKKLITLVCCLLVAFVLWLVMKNAEVATVSTAAALFERIL